MEKQFERIDDLQCNGLKIIQDSRLFCFGMDAVLLCGFAKIQLGARVLDLCTGNGIIPLLLSQKTKAEEIVGLELLPESCSLAERSIRLNGLEDRISILCGDVKEWRRHFAPASFSHITCNPPYLERGGGIQNLSGPLLLARHEVACTLDDIVGAAAGLLCHGGKISVVYRPYRLVDLFCCMRRHRLEPKRMRMVHPRAGEAANLVLVEAVLNGRMQLNLEKPLVVYREDGAYTDEINQIYGRGCQ